MVLYAVHNGAHSVPGGPELGSRWLTAKYVGSTNRDIDAPDEIWHFFGRHRRSFVRRELFLFGNELLGLVIESGRGQTEQRAASASANWHKGHEHSQEFVFVDFLDTDGVRRKNGPALPAR